jgi:hypothetical protein
MIKKILKGDQAMLFRDEVFRIMIPGTLYNNLRYNN